MSPRLDELLDRVRTWPAERQEQAEEVLAALEQLDNPPFTLSPEQIENVRQRLAEPPGRTFTMAEVRARFVDGDE